MKSTFADLQQQDAPSVQDILDTLEDYASTGCAIASRVVIEIIQRVVLKDSQKRALRHIAESGELRHAIKGGATGKISEKEALEYARVKWFLS